MKKGVKSKSILSWVKNGNKADKNTGEIYSYYYYFF